MKVNIANKFETRKKNFEMKKSKIGNIMGERQEYALRLRKDKLNDEIMNKRMKYFSSNEITRINKNELNLEDSFIKEYNQSSNKFKFLSKNLESKDTNILKFSISNLNDYISDELPGIEIDKRLVELLFSILFEDVDEDLKYECSWIIINLTYKWTDFLKKVLFEQEILSKIINLIGKTNNKITNNILYIIGNLTTDESTNFKDFILKNTSLKEILLDYLPKIKPNFVKRTLLWCISNIINTYSADEIEYILTILNNDYLNNCESTRAVLREALINICNITNLFDQKYNYLLFKLNIHETVMNSLKTISESMENKDIILQVKLTKIITNLTLGNVKEIKELLDLDLISTYEDILKKIMINTDFSKDYKPLAKEICVGIANMTGTSEGVNSIIVKDSRLCSLILDLDNVFKDNNIKNEIVRIFHNSLDCGTDKINFELLRLPVIEFFIESLKVKELDNLILSLIGLKNFLDYSKEIIISYDYKVNIVQKQIESIPNGVNLIENCENSDNKEISELASEIISTYFTKAETNKINN